MKVLGRLAFMLPLLLIGPHAHGDVMADIVSAWSAAFSSFADSNTGLTVFPLLTIPLGGRDEGMAGAYAAFGGGAEGLDANPASSPLMKGGEIFFSHRDGISDSSIESIAAAGSAGPFGVGAFSKIFIVPFTRYDSSGLAAGSGYYTETVAAANVAILLLPLPGNGGLTAGANLKAAARIVPPEIAQDQTALAFALDIGLLARFPLPLDASPANVGAGIVLRNVKVNAVPPGYPLPTMLSLGLSLAPLTPVTIDVDVDIPVALDGGGAPAAAVSAAVGLAVRISGFAGVHAGFRLRGDNPLLTLGADIGLGTLDIVVNYSLDLMGGANPLGNYSVSATVPLGK